MHCMLVPLYSDRQVPCARTVPIAVFQMLLLLVLVLVATLLQAAYVPPGPLYQCPEKPLLLFPCQCEAGGDNGLIIRCENSNLASLSVGMANLATLNAPVERLTISKCHIRQ
jgi:hypothetical protein